MKKICIITNGHISTDPRLVKEARSLSRAGFKVEVIFTQYASYLIPEDQEILKNNPDWSASYLDWSPENRSYRYMKMLKALLVRIVKYLSFFFERSLLLSKLYLNRNYSWQLEKAIKSDCDHYIAHNAGALAVAAEAALTNGKTYSFDAEDFHRGENLETTSTQAIINIENKYLKGASYVSAASPLINKEYSKLYPCLKIITINNVFPLASQPNFKNLTYVELKLFWFSQTIGPNRGLEEFITLLGRCRIKDVSLTLLGRIDSNFKRKLISLWTNGLKLENLKFIDPVSENKIFELAADHHIGLCLETANCLNRDICLTNKIFTYLISGCAIIFNETRAQSDFLNKYPGTGYLINLQREDINSLDDILVNDFEVIRKHNYNLAKSELHFEKESEILIDTIKRCS